MKSYTELKVDFMMIRIQQFSCAIQMQDNRKFGIEILWEVFKIQNIVTVEENGPLSSTCSLTHDT